MNIYLFFFYFLSRYNYVKLICKGEWNKWHKTLFFQRKIDGVIKDFYPKTNTNLVIRETSSGEQTVDDILDKKGGFIPYSEESADKQTDTELMFDIVENVSSSKELTTTREL